MTTPTEPCEPGGRIDCFSLSPPDKIERDVQEPRRQCSHCRWPSHVGMMLARAAALLVVALWAAMANGQGAAGPPPVLRYLTLNLLHGGVLSGLTGADQDLDRRLEMVVEELRALDPDVIGLQEASTSRQRGNVAERLAAGLGFYYVYAPAAFRLFDSQWLNRLAAALMNFTEGPAIVSRFPIAAWEAHRLPRCGRFADPRVLLFAELLTSWGRLAVFSTHTSGDVCHTQRVAELVRERRGVLPAILMGDLNAVETSSAVTLLTEEAGFIDVFRTANPAAPGPTVWQRVRAPAPTVLRRVDYLFLAPGSEVPGTVLRSRVVLDAPRRLLDGSVLWPSDHYGVVADLDVLPRSAAAPTPTRTPDRSGPPEGLAVPSSVDRRADSRGS